MLYLVSTPIGNLEDITYRAVRVLGEVSLIAAEDTRTTKKLLNHYNIQTPLISYHEHSNSGRIAEIIIQAQTADVALVSDAGTPALSDPGYKLVEGAVAAGVQVSPIPGAAAAIAALVSSGLPTDAFLFLGFLPRQQKARREALQDVVRQPYTLIYYESPHRLLDTLKEMGAVFGERQVAIGRELTKLYEEFWRGKIGEAQRYFAAQERVRGELTLVVAGAEKAADEWTEVAVIAELQAQLAEGKSKRDAVTAVVALSGWRKKKVYSLALDLT